MQVSVAENNSEEEVEQSGEESDLEFDMEELPTKFRNIKESSGHQWAHRGKSNSGKPSPFPGNEKYLIVSIY